MSNEWVMLDDTVDVDPDQLYQVLTSDGNETMHRGKDLVGMVGSVYVRIPGSLSKTYRKANDAQIGGDHYESKAIQPWDYITSNNMGYLEGNVVKYVSRWKEKNGVEDLNKAQHYLQKLIEIAEGP